MGNTYTQSLVVSNFAINHNHYSDNFYFCRSN